MFVTGVSIKVGIIDGSKPIRLIELFGGIGSQAMALRDLGVPFEHYRMVEIDIGCVVSYNAIHGTNFVRTDIQKITGDGLGIEDVDRYTYLMTYSFPCQDLSTAGKRRGMEKGSGTRSGLLWEVERLLRETAEKPQVLLMENVKQVHSPKNMGAFQSWIDCLASMGYQSVWCDLLATDFDVPQGRERCFMVSWLGQGEYSFPVGPGLTHSFDEYLESVVPDEMYCYYDRALDTVKHLMQTGAVPLDWNCLLSGRQDIVYDDYNSRIRADRQTMTTLTTNCGCRAIKNAVKILEIQRYNPFFCLLPTQCVFQTDHGRVIARLRTLTSREAWRLMGFPDKDYDAAAGVITGVRLYKQAGNSIVRPVLMAVIANMM